VKLPPTAIPKELQGEVKPIASGWGGALALGDQGRRVWFHSPEGGGWLAPEYFVWLVNSPVSMVIE